MAVVTVSRVEIGATGEARVILSNGDELIGLVWLQVPPVQPNAMTHVDLRAMILRPKEEVQ